MSVGGQRSTLGVEAVPFVQEAGWVPRHVHTGAENLALTGSRSTDRPARRKSLYRLRYKVLVPDIKYQSYQY
jgi:hypothetical protein